MSEEQNAKQGALVLAGERGLVTQSSGLLIRGLQLADECGLREIIISENECIALVQRYVELKSEIGDIPSAFLSVGPHNPHDVATFGINRYLDVFTHVKMQGGFVLDYVYAFDGHGGEPLVYARPINNAPIRSPREYFEGFALPHRVLQGQRPTFTDSLPYLAHMEFDKSANGFFDFALFCLIIRRFYLYWHSNYNDRRFILTRLALNDLIKNRVGGLSDEDIALLESLDLSPRVLIHGDFGEVRVVCFGLNSGYTYCHIFLEWPNKLIQVQDESIVRKGCPTLY